LPCHARGEVRRAGGPASDQFAQLAEPPPVNPGRTGTLADAGVAKPGLSAYDMHEQVHDQ
jgi:hypothetical protein